VDIFLSRGAHSQKEVEMKTLIRRTSSLLILLVLLSLHYSQSLEIGYQIKPPKGQVNEASLFPSKASRSAPWPVKEGLVFEGFKEKSLDGKRRTDEVLQFVAGGHVLGFRKGEVFIASGHHALRIEFINARPVSPSNEGISLDTENNRQVTTPLGRVSYSDLWDGVTLVYERHGSGVVKSTYTVQPAGTEASSPVDRIRLRYNVPVVVEESGNLVLSFETGQMKESRPVAWQEIKGEHIPVEVSFSYLSEREVGLKVGSYNRQFPLVIDPVLSWHTYMGSADVDYGNAIAVDMQGNIYVTGWSEATWGTPINPYAGGKDAFVAKLNNSGVRKWHTFLGSAKGDYARAIAVDSRGNVYVAGGSEATWGTPIASFDWPWATFAAKLNSRGVLKWHTFLGSASDGSSKGIAVDTSGNVYVAGWSGPWGTPINPNPGGVDAFLAKLNSSGVLQWHTFMGSYEDFDYIRGIALDTSGNVYVAGGSEVTWGWPVNSHTGDSDVFAAKLNSSGVRQWHTFMGSASSDSGTGIAVDGSGNVYVLGDSNATWGTPVNAHAGKAGKENAFVAKLNSRGVRQWNTFMGSETGDLGWAIAVDTIGNVYVEGMSGDTWGTPVDNPAGFPNAFVAKLNNDGARLWHTFMETGSGHGKAIAVDGSGNIYVGGGGDVPWGTPINPHAGDYDVFVAKIDRGIRIASWNILNYSDLNGDSREEDFRKVIDMIEPDILVVQEMKSAEGVSHFLKNVLNPKPPRQYKAAEFIDGPDTDNALFYDKTKLELQSSQQIPTSFRDISEYCLKIKEGPGKDCEFNIYSVHLKEGLGASNRKQRKNEANTLRTYLNGLPPESHFLVCGTFNMISSNEKAYKLLTGDLINNIGRLKDPINRFGRWHNKMKFRPTHTESTRKTKFGDGESGGLDDRFDVILISYGLDQNGELFYSPGSFVVFGNDGKHLNKAINEPMNKVVSPEIADALYKASDHLPVIIDLVFWDKSSEKDRLN